MNVAIRQEGMRELTKELRAIEDRAFALSVYDYPELMSVADLVIFALTIYDSPEREVSPEQLREVLTKCGQFGIVAIEGVTADYPYLNLGKYNDSLESLQRTGVAEVNDTIRLTSAGKQIGATMLASLGVQGTQELKEQFSEM